MIYACCLYVCGKIRNSSAMRSSFRKNAIEERVTEIMKIRKKSLFAILIGAMIISLAAAGCGASDSDSGQGSGEDNVIRPAEAISLEQDTLGDGEYSVSFTDDSLAENSGEYEMTVEVYEYDRYKADDVDRIEAGSEIQYCNDVVKIETVEKDSETGFVIINGGIENYGIELTKDGELYRTVTMDDYPVYYSLGTAKAVLSDELVFEDHYDWDNEPEGLTLTFDDFLETLKGEESFFTCANTVVKVEQGKIVQVTRHWVP